MSFGESSVVGKIFGGLIPGLVEKKEPAPIPQAPASTTESAAETIAKSKSQAEEALRQKQAAARRSKSVFSSPLGLAGEAATAKKYLLGQ